MSKLLKPGTRVILRGKPNHSYNGRRGTIKAVEYHGKTKTAYYRVEQIDGINSSLLYKANQVEPV